MNVIRQILAEILQRPFRTFLMSITLFILVAFTVLGSFLHNMVENIYHTFIEMRGCSIYVQENDFSTLSDWEVLISQVSDIPDIVGYNTCMPLQTLCEAVDFYNSDYIFPCYKVILLEKN